MAVVALLVMAFVMVIMKLIVPEQFFEFAKYLLTAYVVGNVVSKMADK